MLDAQTYRGLADAVLVLHLGIVVFVVGGLVAVVAGNLAGWHAVDRLGFRLAHLLAIAIVVAEAWTGVVCPLTSLEMALRVRGHGATYDEGFIEHWLQPILYHDAPPWVFTLGYTLFGLAVVASWWYFPPEPFRSRRKAKA